MIKVVLDANIFISAYLTPHSKPAAILDLVRKNRLELLISSDILLEIQEVLLRPRLMKLHHDSPELIAEFIETITAFSTLTPGVLRLQVIKNDPDDDKYLECALEGRADYIISGDHHLTDLETYQEIMIVDPATFVNLIANKGVKAD